MNLREKLNNLLHHYHKTEADIEKVYYFPINTNHVLQLDIIKTLELLENLEPDNTDLIKLQFKGADFIIDCIDILDENDEYDHSIMHPQATKQPWIISLTVTTKSHRLLMIKTNQFTSHGKQPITMKTSTRTNQSQKEKHQMAKFSELQL